MVLGRYLLSALVLSLLGAGLARPTPEDVAELSAPPPARRPQAIYVTSNEVAGNAVVAFKINNDGTLSDGSVTATGGKGGNGFNVNTNSPNSPDALGSQGSVRVVGRHLLVVNAGSNTVTLFEIDADDATKLVMVGKPTYTLGDFPVSVAVSERLQQACVANTGVKAGIACFQITSGGLVALESQLSRVFDLQQTTPPSILKTDISHTVFNDDSTALITTVRSDASHTGLISVYPVLANGRVSTHDVRTFPPRTAMLFGVAPIPGTRDPRTGSSAFVIADPSFGAGLFRISATTGAVATVALTAIPNQNGTCWAAYSPATRSVFVADAGGSTLVEIDPATGAVLQDLHTTVGNLGSIDLVAPANGFVYALSFATDPHLTPAVAVYDVTAGRATARQVQNFRPSAAFRLSNNAQGMAVY
ncbi:MAG: hypothetical protein M1826_003271 [Phylliscum demangeonii]|nr:MAG: hypothetical protein M1826_003271 [Phylliscum demangeonii]